MLDDSSKDEPNFTKPLTVENVVKPTVINEPHTPFTPVLCWFGDLIYDSRNIIN